MEGSSGGAESGQETSNQHSPRLVTYKGKSFTEWADLRNVSLDMPLSDLRDIFHGASLLAETSDEQKAVAIIANGAFGHVIRHPTELTPELKNFLVTTIAVSYSYDWVGVLTPIEDALAQVTPERQAFLLNELLMPVEETAFGFRLQPRVFSRKIAASSQFPNAYNDLVANWDKHPAELREAILDAETHLPALGQTNSVHLLTRLVKEAYDAATSDTQSPAAMTDLQMKAAFILAATKPKNIAVQQQLEKLLSGVLTKPHVLRRNPRAQGAESEFDDAPEPARTRPLTIHRLDADRLHAAVALRLACGGSLSKVTARQFADLIVQDTERHEVGTFRIVAPPNDATAGGPSTAVGGMEDYSDEGLAGYAPSGGGGGYPGMTGGVPGMPAASSGYPGAAPGSLSPGKYPAGAMIWHKNQGYSADFGEFSRRLLMIRLLLEAPPEDSGVKNKIGEQLAATLLKRYPEGFLPAPHDESQNVNVYDLIEAEFQSGVRFRKRPKTKNQVDLETARFIDAASAVVWDYLPDDRRMQIHQNRVAELQAAQAAATKPKQLYDGRPFEEWLAVVNTERSPERLSEAVTALTILGKNRRDTEAAYALLKCLAPFSINSSGQKTPEGRLVSTIDHRFWQLARQAIATVTTDLTENGNSSQRKFLLVHNSGRIKNWLEPGGVLATPQFVNALLQATHDDNPEVRWQATTFLIPLLLTDQLELAPEALAKSKERLTALLSEPGAQTPAAICLSLLAPETPGLTDILLSEIEQLMTSSSNGQFQATKLRDNHYSLQFPDAYWALRKLIVHDRATQTKLTPQLLKLLETRRAGSAGRIFEVDYYRFDHRTLIAELLVSGAPPSDDSKATIRTALETIVKVETQWADRRAGNIEFDSAFSARASVVPESTTGTTPPNTTAYTPTLTDDYLFPLPSALRYPSDSAWDNRERNQHADELKAAKWALQQLEKSLPLDKADE